MRLDNEALAKLVPGLTALRRDIHAHPELAYQEVRTAALVASELANMGLDVTTGIGKTGVVGTLRRGSSNRTIGLRADMDALGFHEETGAPHASTVPGIFHGCGHDGHTAILLGAARYLAATGGFDGTVQFIFQPAEEGMAGARAMIDDRLFDRFPCDSIFALHNWPDLPAGTIQTRPGPIMAAADKFEIVLTGKGGHAALPDQSPDAILAAAMLVCQLHTIVARRVPANAAAVLTVSSIHGGEKTHNVMPAQVSLIGTVRTFAPAVQDRIEASLREMAAGVARSCEIEVEVSYTRYYPATVNDPECARIALAAAASVCNATEAPAPAFTSEDFAFMLQSRPGAYVWLGQGSAQKCASLHNPKYDFNDDVIATGVSWFVELVRQCLPEQAGSKL
jgi:hippurate hydrolase